MAIKGFRVATTIIIAGLLLLSGLSFGHGSAVNAAAGKASVSAPTVQAKFADLQALHTATTDSALKFANLVKKYTKGSVQITVYPNAELGTGSSILQGIEANTIQFYATPDLSAAVSATDALELPYLFPSAKIGSEVLNGPVTKRVLWKQFTSHGLQILGVWSVGYSDILTTAKKISSPGDLKGLRIRIFDPYVGTKLFSLVGADGISMASTQVPTALSTHAIDGADDPPSTMYGSNWYGSAHYLAITDDVYVSSPIVVSSAFYASLTASQRAAVTKAFKQTLAQNLKEAAAKNSQAIKKMHAAGIVVTHPKISVFKKTFLPVYGAVEKDFPGVVKPLQRAVKAAQRKASKGR